MDTRELIQAGFRYALSLVPHRADAEDMVQEAWLRLHRKGGVQDRAQLFLTIRRLFIDRYRREQVVAFASLADVPEIEDASPVFDRVIAAADLERPLAELREDEREALFLNVVEGYSALEIAGLTQRPRNTVLSLIYRAKGKLIRALTDKRESA